MTHSKAPRPHAPRTAGPSAGYPRSGGFKPVALPALAAAVQALKAVPRRKKRAEKPHELPAILRDEVAYS